MLSWWKFSVVYSLLLLKTVFQWIAVYTCHILCTSISIGFVSWSGIAKEYMCLLFLQTCLSGRHDREPCPICFRSYLWCVRVPVSLCTAKCVIMYLGCLLIWQMKTVSKGHFNWYFFYIFIFFYYHLLIILLYIIFINFVFISFICIFLWLRHFYFLWKNPPIFCSFFSNRDF